MGLNWYVNNNLNVMFDYVYDYRYDMNTVGPRTPSGHRRASAPGCNSNSNLQAQTA